MMNIAAPAASKGSPLDNALNHFSQNRTATPATATATKANTNNIDTTKRQAHTTSPAYRPAYAYLGEAVPDIYATPGLAASPVGSLRLAFPRGANSQSPDGKVADAAKANGCK